MSTPNLCKVSHDMHVNHHRFRKALTLNDLKAVNFLWPHVDIIDQAPEFLKIAAKYSQASIVESLLKYVDINSQQFTDAMAETVGGSFNPDWKNVLPLFLHETHHNTAASLLLNYLLFDRHVNKDVVDMLSQHLTDNAHPQMFNILAKKCAQNNRFSALQNIWPYCTVDLFFQAYPLETWNKQNHDIEEFLNDAFAQLQRNTILNTLDDKIFVPHTKKI